MRAPSRVTLAAVGVAAILVAGLVTGGVLVARAVDPPSPTTTVVDADGDEVVLDWADYPGSPEVDPNDVLAAPRADAVAAVGEADMRALEDALAVPAPELAWHVEPNPNGQETFPTGGNGYGGASMHEVYNSSSHEGSALAADADWRALAAALDAELADLGFAPIAWDFDRAPYPHETQAERDAEVERLHGSLEPASMWMWSGTATRGSTWMTVTIWDERRPSAPSEGWSLDEAGVSLFAGGIVIAEGDEAAYAAGVAPFDGLARPQPTHSD